MDARAPRDGRVIEELGIYDPMVPETDARAILNGERIDYWLSVGAQPSDKVKVLIKKYGTSGTHLQEQQAAVERVRAVPPVLSNRNPMSASARQNLTIPVLSETLIKARLIGGESIAQVSIIADTCEGADGLSRPSSVLVYEV